jgi:hypothetical protein
MDQKMYEKLKLKGTPGFPTIFFILTDLTLKEAAKSKDAPYVYDAKGDLVVAGTTNKITMALDVLPLGDKKLKISGSTSLKMTDFHVEPPVLIGILSTGDAVKVLFVWTLEQKVVAAAAK